MEPYEVFVFSIQLLQALKAHYFLAHSHKLVYGSMYQQLDEACLIVDEYQMETSVGMT